MYIRKSSFETFVQEFFVFNEPINQKRIIKSFYGCIYFWIQVQDIGLYGGDRAFSNGKMIQLSSLFHWIMMKFCLVGKDIVLISNLIKICMQCY